MCYAWSLYQMTQYLYRYFERETSNGIDLAQIPYIEENEYYLSDLNTLLDIDNTMLQIFELDCSEEKAKSILANAEKTVFGTLWSAVQKRIGLS